MILSVRIEGYSAAWSNVTPKQYAVLRDKIPQLPPEKEDHPYRTLVVDDAGIRALADLGLDVNLSEDHSTSTMVVKLADRVSALEARQGDTTLPQKIMAGAAVQISIPDLALLYINEVTHMDDACTDTVQEMLNEGWRILAVCPPNAQRRPDYILGRRKKIEAGDGGVPF
jgi:hypothetical protein